jgi:GNAT superfamily N-acetyltransferase
VSEATIALAAADVVDGRGAEVEETLRTALQQEDTEPSDRLQARRFLAELALHRGDADAAEGEARAGLGGKSHEPEKVPLWRLVGQAQELRQPGSGRAALERALELARTTGRRLEEARALAALAQAGFTTDRDAALASARAIFEQSGAERDLVALGARPR